MLKNTGGNKAHDKRVGLFPGRICLSLVRSSLKLSNKGHVESQGASVC